MTAFGFNPFTWDNSSKTVQSRVTSLELKDSNSQKINVSNLENDIEIVIPISIPKTNNSDDLEFSFLKPRKMAIRRYHAELADVPVTLKLAVRKEGTTIEIFVKFGSRPRKVDFDQNFTMVFTSTCGNQTHSNRSCVLKEASVIVVPSEAGSIYFGLLYLGAKNENEHARMRRSCFGHGRERRSCVGVKDPPPKGVTRAVVPQYDPTTDTNYSLTVTQSSCLYWSDDKQK